MLVFAFFLLLCATMTANVQTDPTVDVPSVGIQRFQASLSGALDVPPVDSAATGHAVLVLADDVSTLQHGVMANDIDGMAAGHIHLGESDGKGPFVFWLADQKGNYAPAALLIQPIPSAGPKR